MTRPHATLCTLLLLLAAMNPATPALAAGEDYRWAPEGSPSGPLAIIVSGHEYHTYAQDGSGRSVYIGKDDDGTPEFLDDGSERADVRYPTDGASWFSLSCTR